MDQLLDDTVPENSTASLPRNEVHQDKYWNYKCSEFLLDSLFAIATIYEKYGDGLGMFVQSKMLLPLLHGLGHHNYTNSIHRYIVRVLCEATPREALKIIHERFSNKKGKYGGNIFKDRRLEHCIGTLKHLIGRLGSNFDQKHVQLCNKTLDIKDELYYTLRKSSGVKIRSGAHHARDDSTDYKATLTYLRENEAFERKTSRSFGDYDLHEDLMVHFDRAQFYRWLSVKNEEAKKIIGQKI